MKFFKTLSMASALAVLAGCGNNEANATKKKAPAAEKSTKVKTYRPTPYDEISAHLDQGGDYYMIMSGEQIIKKVGELFGQFEEIAKIGFAASRRGQLPASKSPDEVIAIVKKIINNTGITDLYGVGISSVPVAEKMNRVRAVVTHKAGKGNGLLWKLTAHKNCDFSDLKMLPKDTVYAGFGNCDLNFLYSWLDEQVKASGVPQLRGGLKPFVEMIKMQTQIDILELIKSTTGESGLVFTMDKAEKVTFNVEGKSVQVAKPNAAFVCKVKEHKIFDLLNKSLPPMFKRADANGVKSITIPVPPVKEVTGMVISPVISQVDDMLIISLNNEIVNDMLSAKKSGDDISKSEEFKRLSKDIPLKGYSFEFLSERLLAEIGKTVKKSILDNPDKSLAPQQRALFEKQIMSKLEPYGVFGTSQLINNGVVYRVNSGKDSLSEAGALVATVPVIYAAVVASVAVPALANARAKAEELREKSLYYRSSKLALDKQREANIMQVELAKERYSVDRNVPAGEKVSFENIRRYIPLAKSLDQFTVGGVKIKLGKIGETASY